VVFRVSPVRRALSRSTGPEVRWRRLQKGSIPRRASARRSGSGSGRKLRHVERAAARTDSRREQSFEAGDPAVWSASPVTCAVVEPERGATRVRFVGLGEGGKLRPVPVVAIVGLVPPPRLRVERATETLTTSMRRRAGTRSSSNPQGSIGRRRGGTALREGKALQGEPQGRLRHETRPRSFGGRRRLERARGNPGLAGRRGSNRRGAEKARGRHR
jgi:hypothetical protein